MLKKMRKSPPIMYVKTFSKSHNTYVCTNIEGGLKVTYYGAVNRIQFAMLLGARGLRQKSKRIAIWRHNQQGQSFTQNETISCRRGEAKAVSFRAGCFGRFRLWSVVGRRSLVYQFVSYPWLQIITQVINHNLGYRNWPSLAQHSITQVMIYNLGYDL